MKSPTLLAADLKNKFKRPSSITIQFGQNTSFDKAVNFYSILLETVPVTDATSARFPVGRSGLFAKKDIELLLLKPGTTQQKNDSTVIYWEVRGELQGVYDEILEDPNYGQVIPPSESQPINSIQRRFDLERRSLIEDKAGNQFGLIMNPNFPRLIILNFLPIPKFLIQNLKPLTALLVILGIGFAIPSLRHKRFR